MKPFVFKNRGRWVAVPALGAPLARCATWAEAMEAATGAPLVSEATA